MKIIHIVSSLDKINFGIYNAAIFGSQYLSSKYKTTTFAFSCSKPALKEIHDVTIVDTTEKPLDKILSEHNLSPNDTIVISHGCWLMPSRLGSKLSKMGFRWIYVPHGMLEPWSLSQASIKKKLYFHLIEKKALHRADRVRAVSEQEQTNLSKLRSDIDFIPNGVSVQSYPDKTSDMLNFLFLGRLHHKKGILPFVKAWNAVAANNDNINLIIAGPDQGELEKVKPYITGNVEYVGPVYGKEKDELLKKSHYFVLPSFSEGFPVSVLEAMSFGLIPLISSGCNFDDVFTNALGHRIEPEEKNIEDVLKKLSATEFDHDLSKKNWNYIKDHYSEAIISDKLMNIYQEVLKS